MKKDKNKKRIDREADGKQELDYGVEELEKEPKTPLSVNTLNQEGDAVEGEDQKKKTKESENKYRDTVIKAVRDRWNLLKAKLKNEEAFLDLEEAQSDEKEPTPPEGNSQGQELPREDMVEGGKADNADESEFDPKQLEMGIEIEMEHTNDPKMAKEIAMDHLKENAEYYTHLKDMEAKMKAGEQAPQEGEAPQEGQEMSPEDQAEMEGTELSSGEIPPEGGELSEDQVAEASPEEASPEEVEQLQEEEQGDEHLHAFAEHLREQGYSDSEIAYVVHGHSAPQVDPVDQSKIDMHSAKMEADKAAAERDGAMKEKSAEMEADIRRKEAEIDHSHKQRMNDHALSTEQEKAQVHRIEIEHKKRMLDLEYEKAQAEKDMDLEFKQKELELKLKNKEQAAKDKDARTTDNARDLKKSIDYMDKAELEKAGWSYNKDTQNFNHSTHGSIQIKQKPYGDYELHHNGNKISSAPFKSDILDNAASYMRQINKPVMQDIGEKSEKDKDKDADVSVERPDSSTPQSSLPNYGFSKDEE